MPLVLQGTRTEGALPWRALSSRGTSRQTAGGLANSYRVWASRVAEGKRGMVGCLIVWSNRPGQNPSTGKPLRAWCAAADTPLVPLQRFAKGLRDDYDAVKAGITLPWSNGPVEGHINRLKMLKRQMFGRAGIDLLHRRIVLAPGGIRGCP